jgi:hypothetical protein
MGVNMEQPLLRLGLLGFSDSDKQKVLEAIANPGEGWPRWELTDFEHADAWCINGRGVERLEGNRVLVRTLLPRQPTISLDPSQITRPIAFTDPMPDGVESTEIVNFRTPQLMRVGLQRFEAWLRPLRAQFALGYELIEREKTLNQGVYHVLDNHGKLLAIVNLIKWTAALLPIARPVDFSEAAWVQRPAMAADTPPGFMLLTVVELMWVYATRTTQDVLPARYRKQKIYLRKPPNLPHGSLLDEHLMVLRALATAPAKLADLQKSTCLPENLLESTLSALYFAGSITTNSSAASDTKRVRSPVGEQSSLPPDSHMFGHSLPTLPNDKFYARPGAVYEGTAPAPLLYKH